MLHDPMEVRFARMFWAFALMLVSFTTFAPRRVIQLLGGNATIAWVTAFRLLGALCTLGALDQLFRLLQQWR